MQPVQIRNARIQKNIRHIFFTQAINQTADKDLKVFGKHTTSNRRYIFYIYMENANKCSQAKIQKSKKTGTCEELCSQPFQSLRPSAMASDDY